MTNNGSTEICRCGLVYQKKPSLLRRHCNQCMIRVLSDHIELESTTTSKDKKIIEFRDLVDCKCGKTDTEKQFSFSISFLNGQNKVVSETFLCSTENSRREWLDSILQAKKHWLKVVQQKYELLSAS